MKENLIDVTISNKQILDHLTAGLSEIDRDKAVKSGLSKGGEVLKQGGINRLKGRMKAGSNGKTGNLLRSFYVRVKRNKPGVLAGFTKGKNGGNHSHLVDLGTISRMQKSKNRKRRYKGGSSGAAPGNHFWEDTRDLDTGKAMNEIQAGIVGFVERVKAKCV